MKPINESFLIDAFNKVLKSGDLEKLINLEEADSNKNFEEHLISIPLTSDQYKTIQSLNIDEKTEEHLLLELKEYFFKKITDFIYSNKKIIQKEDLHQTIDNQIVLGSSGAIMDIPENISTILDYNKRFNDNSLAITDIINLIIDYNSIRIQTIGMESFVPIMNCKFSFCLVDSE